MKITVRIYNEHAICVNEHGLFFVEATDEHEEVCEKTLDAVIARLDKRAKARPPRPRVEKRAGFYILYNEVKEVAVTSVYIDETWQRAGLMCRFTMPDRSGKPERKNAKATSVFTDTAHNRGIIASMRENRAKFLELNKAFSELEKKLTTFAQEAEKEEAEDDGPALRIV